MELASIPQQPATAHMIGVSQQNHKASKKQAKLMQQRLDRLARVNIHLHGKIKTIKLTDFYNRITELTLNNRNLNNQLILYLYLHRYVFKSSRKGFRKV